MYPTLFEIGNFQITSFGLMLGLSFIVAGLVASPEFERKGYDREVAWSLVLGSLVGGIIGAKLYYAFLNWPSLVRNPLGTVFSRSGLVWYGGLLGGALGVIYVLRREGLRLGHVADVAALSVPAAYAVGRMGCFLVGDDYGKPTDSWVGLAFPEGAPPSTAGNMRDYFGADIPASIPDTQLLEVHPTQLYEIGLTVLILFFLWRIRRHRHRPGWLFSLYLLLAGLERGFVEFFRVKDDRFFGPFTLAQLISLLLILGGAYGVWTLRKQRSARMAAVETG